MDSRFCFRSTSRGLFLLSGLGMMSVLPAQAAQRTDSFNSFTGSYLPESTGEMLSRGVMVGDVDKSGQKDFAIGSALSDANGIDSGRVYLFLNSGITKTVGDQVSKATLTLTGDAGSQLGARIAGGSDLNGDGTDDLVISAPGWNSGAGRVYIFFGRSSWAGVTLANADVVFSGDQAAGQFGGAVLLPGDINGDSYKDLVITAPGRDDSATAKDRGVAYVFLGSSVAWSTRALNTADAIYHGDANADLLGSTAASLGDVNSDGMADWAIAAPKNDDGGADAGQAYVFLSRTDYVRGDNGVGSVASVRIKGDAAGDLLGSGLAGGGDMNGDGIRDILIGAPQSDYNGADSGRVYVLTGRKLQWPLGVTAAKDASVITFHGTRAGDRLGDVDGVILAEVSGDAVAETLMLSRANDDGGAEAGAMYVFLGHAGTWNTATSMASAEITLTGSQAGDMVGLIDSAGAGDLDANNYSELLVGAPASDLGGPDSGEIFVATNVARWFDLDADGQTPSEGDCDDRDSGSNTGAAEVCKDEKDNNCDGQVDENCDTGCNGLTLAPARFGTSSAGELVGFGVAGLLMALRRRNRK